MKNEKIYLMLHKHSLLQIQIEENVLYRYFTFTSQLTFSFKMGALEKRIFLKKRIKHTAPLHFSLPFRKTYRK